jgi:hypothetical protein
MARGTTSNLKERMAWLEAILSVPEEGCYSTTLCEWVMEAKETL